jgi:hypothetical protein
MNAGRGKEGGETVQELEGGEAERGAAGGVGPWQNVEHLVGSAADEVEALEGKRRPGAVADQALEAGAVGGLDADIGVKAEPTAVIPAEHVLGVQWGGGRYQFRFRWRDEEGRKKRKWTKNRVIGGDPIPRR